MAVLKIRLSDDPILHRKCLPLRKVDDRVRAMLADMADTLHATENGAAIAAPQVGLPFQLVVIDYEDQFYQLVNPRIVHASGVREDVEGCLSLPGKFGIVVRPSRVKVEALNEKGEKVVIRAAGEMAKCFCHEIDHLNGEVFWDKVEEWVDPAELEAEDEE